MQKRSGRRTLTMAALAGALCVAGAASANIIISTGNNPQPLEENILFHGTGTISGPALTVTGLSNTSSCLASFSSGENLQTPSKGQARVEAVDGGFTSLGIGLGCTANDVIFALNVGQPGGRGNATITVGGTTGTFALGPGENFFTIVADGGDVISAVSISSDVDLADIRQVRISGSSLLLAPEPGTLALLGATVLALAAKRRRRS